MTTAEAVHPEHAGQGQVLRADGLLKRYGGRVVVDHLSLQVRQGEVVGLLGPNGAGKTTTFHMMVGFERPEGGSIVLGDHELSSMPMYERARAGIGYLPQEPSVFRRLSVEDNLLAILETLDLDEAQRRERLEALLEELGVTHVRKTMGAALSGGERRRVEIARALVISPKFMLLDEPFAGVDPIAVLDIQTIIAQLKKRGIGVLITDHNVSETLRICDRAYILNEGKVLEEGTPEYIASSRRAREIYLGERFRL
ncbi:MAG TPA: LPS export ABC transporter ATP-binding protein [Candidatus Limnocylindrales bacterium]|nr:LPS export ABC transporter ATP-binding protein [Candidatus Limnocylindrales bacterium]